MSLVAAGPCVTESIDQLSTACKQSRNRCRVHSYAPRCKICTKALVHCLRSQKPAGCSSCGPSEARLYEVWTRVQPFEIRFHVNAATCRLSLEILEFLDVGIRVQQTNLCAIGCGRCQGRGRQVGDGLLVAALRRFVVVLCPAGLGLGLVRLLALTVMSLGFSS